MLYAYNIIGANSVFVAKKKEGHNATFKKQRYRFLLNSCFGGRAGARTMIIISVFMQ